MDRKKQDGGAAFARGAGHNGDYADTRKYSLGNEGMSLEDYLAAHAPVEIPEWYDAPEFTLPKPKRPDLETWPIVAGNTAEYEAIKNELYQWTQDGTWDLDEDKAPGFQKAWDDAWALIDKWERARKRHRYMSWRWDYAAEMIHFGRMRKREAGGQ